MPNLIETAFTSGVTLYAIIHAPDGKVWNNVTLAWETFNQVLWEQYAIALAEQGQSGYYSAAFPATAVPSLAGFLSSEVLYQQALASPSVNDAPATGVGQSQGVDVATLATSPLAVSNLQVSALSMYQGAVSSDGISTASKIYFNDPVSLVDTYGGRIIVMTSGDTIREVANIVAYDAINKFLTLAGALTSVPVIGDTFIIV